MAYLECDNEDDYRKWYINNLVNQKFELWGKSFIFKEDTFEHAFYATVNNKKTQFAKSRASRMLSIISFLKEEEAYDRIEDVFYKTDGVLIRSSNVVIFFRFRNDCYEFITLFVLNEKKIQSKFNNGNWIKK